jgi:Putative adhesin
MFAGGRAAGVHYLGRAGQSVRMIRHARPGTVPLVSAVAVVAIAAALVVVALVGAARGGNPGQISVTAGSVGTVDLQAVPGQVRIVGADTSQVTMTGQLHWTGPHAVVASRADRGHVLRLSYRCAAGSPCTGNYLLVVPRRTAVVLRQPAGHVIISGLASSLRITAGRVDISATGLRCPALTAVITSGHLSATFDAAPQRVSVTLASAQATLRLPGRVDYAVSSQVTSGYVHVGIPQASSAARTVTARIDSGELELLPAELAH